MKTITFDNSDEAKLAVLELFGKSVDTEGYIVETNTGERVLTPHNQEVPLSHFGGLRKGSEIIITNDLPSLLEQAEFIEE